MRALIVARGDRGVALLYAMILSMLMCITAAAIISLALSGFFASTKVEVSQMKKGNADQIHSLVYADLMCLDKNFDGTFVTADCTTGQTCATGWSNGLGNGQSCNYTLSDGRVVNAALTYAGGEYSISITVP